MNSIRAYPALITSALLITLMLLSDSCQKKQENYITNSIQFDLAKKAYSGKRYNDSKSLFLKVKEPSELEEAKLFITKIDSITLLEKVNTTRNPLEANKSGKKKNPLDLLQQNIIDWKKASKNDKMVACNAFVNEFNKLSSRHLSAIDVLICVDEATRDLNSTNDYQVGTIITLCSQQILKL